MIMAAPCDELTRLSFTGPTVTVKVGETQAFIVNEQLLRQSSAFFDAALKPTWQEGKERVVNLPAEDDSMSFNAYVNWLHTHQIALGFVDGQDAQKQHSFPRLVLAYALGNKVLDPDFKDAVTDAMVVSFGIKDEKGKTILPDPGPRSKLYSTTQLKSAARRLLAHRMARTTNPDLISEKDCPAFLVDVARAAITKDAESTVDAAARCAFHEHVPGAENCYRNKYT